MHPLILMATVLMASCANTQSPVVSCRLQDQYQISQDQHAAGVDNRGDHAMGFSQESAAHHFILLGLKDGFFVCGHAVENTLDCWQSHWEPSRCTCGGILNT